MFQDSEVGINSWKELFLSCFSQVCLCIFNNYVTLPEITVVPGYKWLASFFFSIYNACLTIFYITGITLLFRIKYSYAILKPLGAMGRMVLTNFLLQTEFGFMFFYHFGLGLFDRTSPAMNVFLAVGVLYLQQKFSQYWLKHFKQGPVEWLWKGMTYFQLSSNKK